MVLKKEFHLLCLESKWNPMKTRLDWILKAFNLAESDHLRQLEYLAPLQRFSFSRPRAKPGHAARACRPLDTMAHQLPDAESILASSGHLCCLRLHQHCWMETEGGASSLRNWVHVFSPDSQTTPATTLLSPNQGSMPKNLRKQIWHGQNHLPGKPTCVWFLRTQRCWQ